LRWESWSSICWPGGGALYDWQADRNHTGPRRPRTSPPPATSTTRPGRKIVETRIPDHTANCDAAGTLTAISVVSRISVPTRTALNCNKISPSRSAVAVSLTSNLEALSRCSCVIFSSGYGALYSSGCAEWPRLNQIRPISRRIITITRINPNPPVG